MLGADTLFSDKGSSRAPLASHPAFAWIMIAWCALLFGLSTLVIAAAFTSSSLLPILLGLATGILGAVCGWQFCKNVGARMPQFRGASAKARSKFVREKNPATSASDVPVSIMSTQDLGSASLDAPLEEYPEASDEFEPDMASDEWADSVNVEANQPSAYFEDPFTNDGIDGPASPNDRHAAPALGRPQFHSDALSYGALEDRPDDANLATEALEPSEELTAQESADDALALDSFELPEAVSAEAENELAGQNSLLETRTEAEVIALKDRDLKDLSLVQMVERFAVGLEGHRVLRANDPASRAVRPSDPRIAQAIRALPIGDLSRSDSDPAMRARADHTEAALREALEKLQRMSDHG